MPFATIPNWGSVPDVCLYCFVSFRSRPPLALLDADCRYLLTNSKDNTLKLIDSRMMQVVTTFKYAFHLCVRVCARRRAYLLGGAATWNTATDTTATERASVPTARTSWWEALTARSSSGTSRTTPQPCIRPMARAFKAAPALHQARRLPSPTRMPRCCCGSSTRSFDVVCLLVDCLFLICLRVLIESVVVRGVQQNPIGKLLLESSHGMFRVSLRLSFWCSSLSLVLLLAALDLVQSCKPSCCSWP